MSDLDHEPVKAHELEKVQTQLNRLENQQEHHSKRLEIVEYETSRLSKAMSQLRNVVNEIKRSIAESDRKRTANHRETIQKLDDMQSSTNEKLDNIDKNSLQTWPKPSFKWVVGTVITVISAGALLATAIFTALDLFHR